MSEDIGDYVGRHRRNEKAPALKCCGRIHAHSTFCINERIYYLLSTDNQDSMSEDERMHQPLILRRLT